MKAIVKAKLRIQEKTVMQTFDLNKTILDLLVILTLKFYSVNKDDEPVDAYIHIPYLQFISCADLSKTLAESKMKNLPALLSGVSVRWPYQPNVFKELGDMWREPLADRQTPADQPMCSQQNFLGPTQLLSHAAATGNSQYVQTLIQAKAPVDFKEENRNNYFFNSEEEFFNFASPLMNAAYRNKPDIVKLLIVQKAKVNNQFFSLSALGFAGHSKENTSDIVFMLLASGAHSEDYLGNPFVYTDSHPEVIKTSMILGKIPIQAKRIEMHKSEPHNPKEVSTPSVSLKNHKDYVLYQPSSPDQLSSAQQKLGRWLMNLFSLFPLTIWSIICSYYIEKEEDAKNLIIGIKKHFLKCFSNLIAQRKEPDNSWLSVLLEMLTTPYYHFPAATLICWHIELHCAQTGQLLSEKDPECFQVFQNNVTKDKLQKAEQSGVNLYRFIQHDHIRDIIQEQSPEPRCSS